MNFNKILCAATLFLTSALANDCNKGFFISGGLGTTGGSAEIGYTMNPTFRTRVNTSWGYHFKRDLTIGRYRMEDVHITIAMMRFLMDWHLLKNGLRLTGGLAYNHSHIKLRRNLAGMTIHGFTLPDGVGFAHVRYHYKKIAPYAGIGFDTGCVGKKGLSLSFDLGCVFTGCPKPKVVLPSTLTAMMPGAQELAHDYFKKLGHDHKFLHYYPVATVGVRYQF